jgi:hypothetical protein
LAVSARFAKQNNQEKGNALFQSLSEESEDNGPVSGLHALQGPDVLGSPNKIYQY